MVRAETMVYYTIRQGAFHVNSTPEISRILPNALRNTKKVSGESDRLREIRVG